MNGSMISWDVEEDPPICIESDGPGLSSQSVDGSHSYSNGKEAGGDSNDSTNTNHTGPNKMKYRCKLCGQLKQNHECPYRKSLHRSIGVMVYPAVNSFTADEPGTVAPPLTKMNNFVSYDSDQGSPEPVYNKASFVPRGAFCPSTVTPATLQHHYHHHPGLAYYSPQSSLSTNHSEDMVVGYSSGKKGEHKRMHSEISSGGGSASRHYKQQQRRSVFVASVTLRPEHYRAVTPSANDESSPSSFQYPVIPLTFAERKRLSDTLFHLSKEIPGMTDDCALILRDARANNEWDLAVSELLAQVVVGLYCGEGDSCLDGLQQYLLALGVSC